MSGLTKAVITVSSVAALTASSALAEGSGVFAYDICPPVVSSPGIGVTINWATAIGSTLIEGGSLNNPSFGPAYSEPGYPVRYRCFSTAGGLRR